jgi:peptidoglycan/LPS O-acetylase OafA/YrhL
MRHSASNHILGASPIGWIAFLRYVQNWWMPFGGLRQMAFLGPLWSLAVEEQFYFMWPLLCLGAVNEGANKDLCSRCVGCLVVPILVDTARDSKSPLRDLFNTLTRMHGLMAGGFCATLTFCFTVISSWQSGSGVWFYWYTFLMVAARYSIAHCVQRAS